MAELAVVRLRLSSTMEKPSSTSVETFSASIAIKTTYIRLIIFWRGETGLFFIAILSQYFNVYESRPVACVGAALLMFTVIASIMRA